MKRVDELEKIELDFWVLNSKNELIMTKKEFQKALQKGQNLSKVWIKEDLNLDWNYVMPLIEKLLKEDELKLEIKTENFENGEFVWYLAGYAVDYVSADSLLNLFKRAIVKRKYGEEVQE